MLSLEQLDSFEHRGFTHVEAVVGADVVAGLLDLVWSALPARPDDPGTWDQAVMRAPGRRHPGMSAAVAAPRLLAAIHDVAGPGPDVERVGFGAFPVRFPLADDPGDAVWHVDGTYEHHGEWFINLACRGRSVLLFLLLTDVGPTDAPTRLLAGSHHDIAAQLAGAGPDGVPYYRLDPLAPAIHEREQYLATGAAGDAYLVHPFLVHAPSWPNRGAAPRVIGQGAAGRRGELALRAPGASVVERAILTGLAGAGRA